MYNILFLSFYLNIAAILWERYIFVFKWRIIKVSSLGDYCQWRGDTQSPPGGDIGDWEYQPESQSDQRSGDWREREREGPVTRWWLLTNLRRNDNHSPPTLIISRVRLTVQCSMFNANIYISTGFNVNRERKAKYNTKTYTKLEQEIGHQSYCFPWSYIKVDGTCML